jgi:osmotically-inducible protein OsmY
MRALLRLVFTLILIVVAGGAGYYYGYRSGSGGRSPSLWPDSLSDIGRRVAPDTGSIGKKVAEAGSEATEFLSDAALTTKIKSKMGLDDHVEAGNIHVSTSNGVVTLTGTVRSTAERQRAVALARDTKNVKSVVDRLQVARE